jgi:3'-phosphoadenosine 5'-phosphosulfate sulfotransferase (PAPS reductase)/FAD synthetase
MKNPYKIEPPFYVSFSGGRTSGMLLTKIVEAWNGMPSGGLALFANTGKEHPATYDFVCRLESHLGIQIHWIEYDSSGVGFRVVTSDSARKNGEPFAELIRKKKFLPNPIARFCTSDLKVKPMSAFMKSNGFDDFTTVIGLRADEPRRVAKLRGDKTRDIAMPLADAGITKDMVLDYWRSMPIDLHLPNNDPAFGNCDCCFLKNRSSMERVMQAEPDLAKWWIEQENLVGGTFRKDRPNFATILHQVTVQGRLFNNDCSTDTSLPCDCTE